MPRFVRRNAQRYAGLEASRRSSSSEPSLSSSSSSRLSQAPAAKPVSQATGPAPAQRLLPSGPPRPAGRGGARHAPDPAADQPGPRDRDRLPRVRTDGACRSTRSARRRTQGSSAGSASGSSARTDRASATTGSRAAPARAPAGSTWAPRSGTDVYAPVDGTVIAIADRILDGVPHGKQIEIQPAGNPSVVVLLTNLPPTRR